MQITKVQIDDAIKGKGDFVKIDYLKRYLQKADNIEIKKYILLTLVQVCESKNIINEAIKNLRLATELSIANSERIELFMKESELYSKIRDFDMAEKAIKKAKAISSSQEKLEVNQRYLDMLRHQAESADKEGKIRHALEYYEKLYTLRQSEPKKIEVREKLNEIYEKLGRNSRKLS